MFKLNHNSNKSISNEKLALRNGINYGAKFCQRYTPATTVDVLSEAYDSVILEVAQDDGLDQAQYETLVARIDNRFANERKVTIVGLQQTARRIVMDILVSEL